jgi:hypothetical protein
MLNILYNIIHNYINPVLSAAIHTQDVVKLAYISPVYVRE